VRVMNSPRPVWSAPGPSGEWVPGSRAGRRGTRRSRRRASATGGRRPDANEL